MIELRFLGKIDVRSRGGEPSCGRPLESVLAQPKRLALLAYLTLSGAESSVRREPLLATFWPESSDKQARNALNQSVFVLRRTIGSAAIRIHGAGALEIDREQVWCDAVAYDEALDRGDLAAALELYEPPLLPGLHVADSRAFESWLDEERSRRHRQALEATLQLADHALADDNRAGAARRLASAMRLSPDDETIARRYIGLLLEMGDRSGAQRAYERLESSLGHLGLSITPETEKLLDEIRSTARPVAAGTDSSDREPMESRGSGGRTPTDPVEPRPSGATGGLAESFLRPRWLLSVLLVAFAAVGGVLVASSIRKSAESGPESGEGVDLAPERVLVSSFVDRTGDDSLDRLGELASEWISLELTRTGLVEVVPEPLLRSTLSAGERVVTDEAARLSETLAAARATGAGLIVRGTFTRSGSDLIAEAALVDAEKGLVLRGVKPVSSPVDAPLDGVRVLRDRISGALATIIDPRLRDWSGAASQPPSIDSYRLYAAGLDHYERLDFEAAHESFMAAASVDPSFTAPLIWAMELPIHENSEVDRMSRPLRERRAELAPWDRLMLDRRVAEVRGDRLAAYRATVAVAELVPRSYWWLKAAEAALGLNDPVTALTHLERARGPHPIAPARRWHLRAEALHRLGRYEEEIETLDELTLQAPESARAVELRALAASGRADEVEARLTTLLENRPLDRAISLLVRDMADELRTHGAPREGRRILRRLLESYEAAPPDLWSDPASSVGYARMLAAVGREAEAWRVCSMLLEEGTLADVARGDLGVLAARSGNVREAERLARWFADASEQREPYSVGWFKQWEARIVAGLGQRARAVELLRQSYAKGWVHLLSDHRERAYESLRGYPPFEELMTPRRLR